MITRIATAAVLIPVVLASLLYGPRWLFLGIASIFLTAALWEYLLLFPRLGGQPVSLCYPLILALPWIWNYLPVYRISYLILSGLLLLIAGLTGKGEPGQMFLSSSLALVGIFYLGIPFALVGTLHPEADPGTTGIELVLVLIAVWITDSAAYFAGRSLGRRKITPRISPGKTLEGFAAGFFSGALFVFFAGTEYLGWSRLLSGGLALAIPLATIYGDLFESLLKRAAEIKDSSNLIPGHGGVLDRIDSLLFALPAYFVVRAFVA